MKSQALTTVEKMFAAFGNGDWKIRGNRIGRYNLDYHGTQEIPKAIFEGKDRAATFLRNILTQTEVLSFEPQQFICEGNMVVVTGQEHQRAKSSGKEIKQKRVQVYAVENNLIIRMEEFASSEVVSQ